MDIKAIKAKIGSFFDRISDFPQAKVLLTLLVIAGFALLPSLIKGNYWVRVLDSAGIYIMLALGLNVILGYAGLLHLGFAAFFAIGAYMWGLLGSPTYNIHMNFWVVFFLAGLVAGIFGYLLAFPGLKLKGDYLALVTIGFGESVRIFLNNSKLTMSAIGIIGIDPMTVGPIKMTTVSDYYYVILVICVVLAFLMRRLENSRIGNAWLAIREDEMAAESMGLDTRRLKLLANFVGAVPAGFAGVVFAALQTYVSPVSFRFLESITILSMVVVGGRANVYGVMLGALLLTIAPEPLRGSDFETARILVYGLLLVFMMLFRPEGIWVRKSGKAHLKKILKTKVSGQSESVN